MKDPRTQLNHFSPQAQLLTNILNRSEQLAEESQSGRCNYSSSKNLNNTLRHPIKINLRLGNELYTFNTSSDQIDINVPIDTLPY